MPRFQPSSIIITCRVIFCSLALFAMGGWLAADQSAAEQGKTPSGRPAPQFFKQHCFSCHGTDVQEAEFRLDDVTQDPNDREFGHPWARALERINSGEMPPPEEPQPTASERLAAAEWIADGLRDWEAALHASQERVSLKRLTREEYANTVQDLLGVTYHPTDPGGLPEDPSWRGFNRIGTVLSLTPSHIERYLSAAEGVLSEVIPLTDQPPTWKRHWNVLGMQYGSHTAHLPRPEIGISEKHRKVVGPGNNWRSHSNSLVAVTVPRSGEYFIRIKTSGLRPHGGGDLPHLVLYNATLDRVLIAQDVDAPEDQPTIIEAKVRLPAGSHDLVLRNELPGPSPYHQYYRTGVVDEFTTLRNGRSPYQLKLSDNDFNPIAPLLILDYMEMEAVVDPWPPEPQRRIFASGAKDEAHARSIITKFAEQAFRRPLVAGEAEQYLNVANQSQALGATFEEGVRDALTAVLCSHDFLFLVEGSDAELRDRLNDWELASRLSYFLWSTMPDEQLLEQARAGNLRDREVLLSQLQRMLEDPRAERLAKSFTHQWLRLGEVGKFPPDKNLYPDYDDQLQGSMIAESQAFFGHVLNENLSIREFLDSNWTMLNSRLAAHYGVEGVVDSHMRPVPLNGNSHRGGVLTQAATLTLTSDGFRHRPVHRGAWILESMFGTTPPPPPPNVGSIPTDSSGTAQTIRQKLEIHREQASCAACHAKIDPLGFALENYDAIGRWRDFEGENRRDKRNRIDASDVLPDGRAFSGPEQFKERMVEDLDRFAFALTEKLATYSIRRGMSIADRRAIEEIVAQAKQDDYRLQSLITALVLSDLFQGR